MFKAIILPVLLLAGLGPAAGKDSELHGRKAELMGMVCNHIVWFSDLGSFHGSFDLVVKLNQEPSDVSFQPGDTVRTIFYEGELKDTLSETSCYYLCLNEEVQNVQGETRFSPQYRLCRPAVRCYYYSVRTVNNGVVHNRSFWLINPKDSSIKYSEKGFRTLLTVTRKRSYLEMVTYDQTGQIIHKAFRHANKENGYVYDSTAKLLDEYTAVYVEPNRERGHEHGIYKSIRYKLKDGQRSRYRERVYRRYDKITIPPAHEFIP